MRNPFVEVAGDGDTDIELVRRAQDGDRDALEKLILSHQAWIYNIALRMVAFPEDAEEVTQEVLIKAITRLSTFECKSKFRTWLYRITTNHVINMKRRGGETHMLSFPTYAAAINDTPDLDLPGPKSVPIELPLLVEEVKIACTTGMLLCLDRRQRLAFTLGAIFGASDKVGSEIMDITADNFRQILSRARRDLYQFMSNQCGLVNPSNPCRCYKKTRGFINEGHVDPHRLVFVSQRVERIRDVVADTIREIDGVADEAYSDIFLDHPFLQLRDQVNWLQEIIGRPDIRTALNLD
jgi:RNA polymerase sigma factor (sigma-70 family)